MLTKILVANQQGKVLELPFEDYSSGYLIKDVTGLDPVKATIVTSTVAGVAGVQAQSTRREARYPVIKLGMQAGVGGSVRQLRKNLYSFFMPEQTVLLAFESDDEPTSYIAGTIESFDAPLFAKEPEATISILCEDPDFYLPDVHTVNGTTTAVDALEKLIEYDGDVSTGVKFTIQPQHDISQLVIHQRTDMGDAVYSLTYELPLAAGEKLVISTNSGNKYALLTNTSSSISEVLYGIPKFSNWITLAPGNNYIQVYAEGASIPYTIEYTTKLGGL